VATRLIRNAIDRPAFLYVAVGSPPFEIQVRHHKLIFEQHESAAAIHLNGVIFLNFDSLSRASLIMMSVSRNLTYASRATCREIEDANIAAKTKEGQKQDEAKEKQHKELEEKF
jgi:hypothetical protein